MKRSTVVLAALAAAVVAAPPALAAAKGPKAPSAVTKSYFLHGASTYGNQDTLGGGPLTLDAKKPTGTTTKEVAIFGGNAAGALLVPKACPGGAYIPLFTTPLSGKLTKQVTVQFWARGTGSNVTVQLLADPSDCTTDLSPLAEALVPVKAGASAGMLTATFAMPASGAKVVGEFGVQFLTDQKTSPGSFGVTGISYDSTAASSSVTFTCVPNAGKTSC